MSLTVRDEDGAVVAEVAFDPQDAHRSLAHVVGSFVEGPGFLRVKSMIDSFLRIYETGDLEGAYAVHREIDELGLTATDTAGFRYRVFNVVFQRDGLLFSIGMATTRDNGAA